MRLFLAASVLLAATSAAAVAQTAKPATAPATPSAAPSKLITVHEGTDMAATISPDHKTILLDLQGLIYSLPAAGGTAKQITGPYDEASHPDWSPTFDSDPKAAATTRARLFAEWADTPTLVIGTHWAAPTAGRVRRDGAAFRFEEPAHANA